MPEGEIYKLIPKVAQEIGSVSKSNTNQQQNYKFRGIDDIVNALSGPMMRNGLFCTTEVFDWQQEERQNRSGGALFYTALTMKVTFYAPDGSFVCTTTRGEAMDSADKSTNKAMSAAFKYAMFQTFMIPTESEDADAVTHEVAPRQAPVQPARAQPRPAVQGTMTPEQRDFNEWITPYVDNGNIKHERVTEIVRKCNRDYKKAKELCCLELQPVDLGTQPRN